MAAPSFIDGTHSQTNSANTLGITVPGDAAAGDVAVAVVCTGVNLSSFGVPSGWTQQAFSHSTSPSMAVGVYTKVLASGDVGAAFSWTFTSGPSAAIACAVYRGQDSTLFDVVPVFASNGGSSSLSFAGITPLSADDLIVGVGGVIRANSSVSLTAAPTGYTIREQDSGANFLAVNGAAVIFDKAAGSTSATGTLTGTLSGADTGSMTALLAIRPHALAGSAEASVAVSGTGSPAKTGSAEASITIGGTAHPPGSLPGGTSQASITTAAAVTADGTLTAGTAAAAVAVAANDAGGITASPTPIMGLTSHQESGATLALTIPATGVRAGQTVIAALSIKLPMAGTLSVPTGWTELVPLQDWGTNVRGRVFSRTLTAGDLGATFNWVSTAAEQMYLAAGVYANVGGISVLPAMSPLDGSSTNMPLPAVIPGGPLDLLVGFSAANGALGINPTMTAPAGYTKRAEITGDHNLGPYYGATVFDGPATDASLVLTANQGLAFAVGGMLMLSPLGASEIPPGRNRIPGIALHGYGNSYLTQTLNATCTFWDRFDAWINPTQANNLGVGGTIAPTICAFAYGTFTASPTGGLNKPGNSNIQQTQAGTWFAQSGRTGLIITELLRNDAGDDGTATNGGTTAKSRAGARNGMDAFLRLVRAASIVEETDSSIAYDASWTSEAKQTYSGGSAKWTSTPGGHATVTFTGTDLDLILLGVDNAAAGFTGAPFTVTVDGSPFATGTTSDQMRRPSAGSTIPTTVQQAVPIRGLAPGTHSITVTHTGSAGQRLYLDCYLIPSASPPTVITCKLATLPAAGYAGYGNGASWAVDQVYNSIIDDVVAQFPTGVLVYDPMASGLWDNTTMISNKDGLSVHLTDTGNAHYAQEMLDLLDAFGLTAAEITVSGRALPAAEIASASASLTVAAAGHVSGTALNKQAPALVTMRSGAHGLLDLPAGQGIGLTGTEIVVQIDWAGTPLGGAPTWTDVTADLRTEDSPIQITWGRQDWTSDVTAATCNLTLENLDGRYTPGNAASPHYPHVKPRARLRVTAFIAGISVHLFDGYIDSLEVDHDNGVFPTVAVEATDIIGRFASSMPLRSLLYEEMLLDAPSAFYPLNDQGPTLGDIAGNSPALTGFVPSGADELAFQTDTGAADPDVTGVGLAGFFAAISSPRPLAVATVEVFFATSGVNAAVLLGGPDATGITIGADGRIGTGGPYNDGQPHQLVVKAGRISVDRADVGAANLPALTYLGLDLVGEMWALALYPAAVSDTRLATHRDACLTGFAGETTDAHTARLLGYRANNGLIPEGGLGAVGVHATDGLDMQRALFDTSEAEGGLVYADGQGRVVPLPRSRLFNPAASLVLTADDVEIAGTTTFGDDVQNIVNDVTVTPPTGATQRYYDQASIDADGQSALELDLIVDSEVHALEAAGWIVSNGIRDQTASPQLDIDLLTEPSASVVLNALLLAPLEVISAVSLPTTAPAASVSYLVEGGRLNIGVNEFDLSLYTTPVPPTVVEWDGNTAHGWDSPTAIWAY